MEIREDQHIMFRTFLEDYSDKIQNEDYLKKSLSYFDQYPLLPSQALYVFDMKNLTIPYQRGIKRLFGYSEEEFNYELITHFYHPDDYNRYIFLVKIVNEWVRDNKPEPFSVEATFDYRVRKKDGTYIKVLRQSTVFEICKKKSVRSSFSIISDISKIKTSSSVNLSFEDINTGSILLEDRESDMEKFQFTKREKEILLKIKEGLNSQSIADEFNCSKHTVDTHRRKILRKSGCKNTVELLNLCTQLGVI